jgi:hypothetical protein
LQRNIVIQRQRNPVAYGKKRAGAAQADRPFRSITR